MEETTPFQLATLLLVSTFKKYAEAEGKKDTLTKAEFRTLLDNEMPSPGNVLYNPLNFLHSALWGEEPRKVHRDDEGSGSEQ
ncbi:unnamed protein product [Pleuronectes platessa]|uniref:S100/CaBP-9k-type calcium binding subdomain domain-containing protein n=1 Tax=Pleuronectes platessa TaxID=8262 RepID=A0A9N7TPC1_PLEPL|nr:unnamed protein product [Pleuronectes platessa]